MDDDHHERRTPSRMRTHPCMSLALQNARFAVSFHLWVLYGSFSSPRPEDHRAQEHVPNELFQRLFGWI